MFNRLATRAHRLRVIVQAALNIFEYVFVFPAGHHALLACRALFAQFADQAFLGRIPPVVHASIPFVRGEHQQLVCRADIQVVIRNVSEVGLDEEALELVVRCLRPGQRDSDTGLGALQNLLT